MARRTLTVSVVLLPLWASTALGQVPLDLTNPDDAVKALRKIQCSLTDGESAVYWWSGTVYSRVPGERDRLLFRYEGMNIRACATVSDPVRGYGYRMVSREALIYLDPTTGDVLRSWTNPWTGEKLDVVHIFNDPVNSRVPTYAHGPNGPYRFDATFRNGRGWMRIEVPLFYANPLAGDYQEYIGGQYHAMELFNFFFDEASLLDGGHNRVNSAQVSWVRVAQWLPWMKMGDRPGLVIYNGAGTRLASWDDLPEVVKKELLATHPEYRQPPPLDDNRPNDTSWSVFKRIVDARRAESR